jgi:hypothetical protein
MRSLPIDSPALRTLKEFFLMRKDKVWNLSFCLLSLDSMEEGIAKQTPGKEVPLVQ